MDRTAVNCWPSSSRGRSNTSWPTRPTMATKPASERREFLAHFIDTPRGNPVIIPMAAHESDLPARCSRVVEIDADEAPQESLLLRLARQ